MAYPDPHQPPQNQPPPAAYGTPPPPGYPAAPPNPAVRKRNTKLIVAGIVGGFIALCCAGGGILAAVSDPPPTPAAKATQPAAPAAQTPAATSAAPAPPAATKPAAPPPATKAAPQAPGIGDKVRDGKFEFTVTGVKCGATRVGTEFLNEKAQGVFCLVSVTVKNIGKEAQTFHGATQKAFDKAGTEFSNDTEAELYANEGGSTFLEEINPGNSVKGQLIFDVPKGTKLTSLELHDSIFSGGVTVELK